MPGTGDVVGSAPVAALAEAHGADAWRVAFVAGADKAAASRAAVHALVIAAVDGGVAARRPAILALARSWALSSPGAPPDHAGEAGVVGAFWSLAEPLRSTLWCADGLGLSPAEVERVLGPAARPAGAVSVARGRLRRDVHREWRARRNETGCGPAAPVVARVLAGHAPPAEEAMVRDHATGCEGCSPLLVPLLDPTATVRASLPAAPDLVAPACTAWRDHVGAPNRTPAERVVVAAEVANQRRRPLTAALALVIAGSFAAATTQLAASTPGPPVPLPLAVAGPAQPAARPAPPFVVRRQAVLPPLAPEVGADPRLARFLVPDLLVVTPVAPQPQPVVPGVPPPAAAPPAAPEPLLLGEPLPAVERPPDFDITLPFPLPVPFDLGPSCPSITLGPLRLALACDS